MIRNKGTVLAEVRQIEDIPNVEHGNLIYASLLGILETFLDIRDILSVLTKDNQINIIKNISEDK